jgi:hypothetical protein
MRLTNSLKEAIVKAAIKQAAPQLPAIRHEDLNKIIGLPSDKEAV